MSERREQPGAAANAEAGASEHARRTSGCGARARPSGESLLNQDEIQSLLGVNGNGGAAGGLQQLIERAGVSYERLPMLEVVFDRLVRIMTTSLRNFTSDNVEVALAQVRSLRFGDYLDSVPLPAMIAVFKAVEWDNYGLLTIHNSLIYSIIDVLLGGRRGTAPMRLDGRAFTSIERALVERLIRLVLHDLGSAFEPLTAIEFRCERVETNPRFVAIARPTNAAVMCNLRVEMDGRGGVLEVLLPSATLEPVRELLLQMFMGEKFGHDSIWESHLAEEMLMTSVELEALLDERFVPLGEVMQLQVGTTLSLAARPDHPVMLRCGQVPMLRGRIGRIGDQIAVRVEDRLARQTEGG